MLRYDLGGQWHARAAAAGRVLWLGLIVAALAGAAIGSRHRSGVAGRGERPYTLDRLLRLAVAVVVPDVDACAERRLVNGHDLGAEPQLLGVVAILRKAPPTHLHVG